MADGREPGGGSPIGRGPLAYVNESLHKVDALLNTTRQGLAKRLRDGASAFDQRKRAFLTATQRSPNGPDTASSGPNSAQLERGFRHLRIRRDRDYTDENAAPDIFAALNGQPLKAGKAAEPPVAFDSRESSGQGLASDGEPTTSSQQHTQQPLRQAIGNVKQNWAAFSSKIQEHLPRLGSGRLPKFPRGRFKFVTLRDPHTPEGEPVRPDSALLNLEEMLKPFSGLSQLLAHRDFRTLEDFNRLINKAAEELEAMREDKLNDGRPLGPLQREAIRRKRARANGRVRSSLRTPGRHVAIYTTASLPWMTGTAVNPLLRAAYLAKDERRKVTLVIPWLAKSDQKAIFPSGLAFDSPEQQEEYVRGWVKQRTGGECRFNVRFYPGRYAAEKCSILPVGDPTTYITDEEADVAVLEEPEHLNWYHHGRRWTDKFRHVVGVIHTNYLDYAMREEDGEAKAKALAIMNQLVCRMHCHKVVKLSDAVQPLPRQTTAFVHGVPHSFIKVGEEKAHAAEDGKPRFDHGAYFIGKAIWAKGYTELLDLMHQHTERGEEKLHIDCYGSGEDLDAMKAFAKKKHLDMAFHGGRDHLDRSMHGYKVFVNPSTSDVVATTTAEALAMGKWVVVHDLPCNRWFSTFSNCLTYRTPEEFSTQLQHAMMRDPHPMKADERQRLTWEAATERFLDVSELKGEEKSTRVSAAIDTLAFSLHNYLTGVEALRAVSGAGVNTRDNPINLKDFIPTETATGGFFDDKKRLLARAAKAAT